MTSWVPPAPYPDAWPPPANPQPLPLTPGPYPPVVPAPGPAPAPAPVPDPGALPPGAVTPPGISGASFNTYNQHTGTFTDADGKAAVFAPGADNLKPQENWYDLMMDPRQT
jgi:phospholipid/cholesterol/gamma-HCH transport system substrate-binding protein